MENTQTGSGTQNNHHAQVQYINYGGDQNIAGGEAVDLGRHFFRSFTTAAIDRESASCSVEDETKRFDTLAAHQSLWYAVSEIGASHTHKQQIERGDCFPGTRESALENIREWALAGDQEPPICLLTGPVGVGKSTIAMTVAKSWQGEGLLVSSFFFLRSDPKRNNPSALVPTIAYGLVSTTPLLRSHIEERISKDPTVLEAGLEVQFRELVFDPLLIYKRLLDLFPSERKIPRIVIIDGLDECGDEETQLRILSAIRSVVEHTPHLPLRFLICSRPESWIQEAFAPKALGRLMRTVALGDSHESDGDITKYYLHHFQNIVSNPKYSQVQFTDPWPSKEVFETVVGRTCGQFVYAVTFVKFIKSGHPIKQLDYMFKHTPNRRQEMAPYRELDALYHSILCANSDHETFLSILAAVFVLEHHLTISPAFIELLLGLPSGQVALSLRGMHSVLEVRGWGDRIRTFHTSFREFLFDRDRSGGFHVDMYSQKHNIMRRWLWNLSTTNMGMYSTEQLYSDETRLFFTQWIYVLAAPAPQVGPTRALLDALQGVDLASVFFCEQASTFHIYDTPTALGPTRVDIRGPGWYRTFRQLVWWVGTYYDDDEDLRSKGSDSKTLDEGAAGKDNVGSTSADQDRGTPDDWDSSDLVDSLVDRLSIRPMHFHLKPPPGTSLEDDIVYWTVLLATACTNRTRLTSRAHSAGERQAPAQLTDCHCDFSGGNQPDDPNHLAYQEACMHLVKAFISDFKWLIDNGPEEENMVELSGIFGNLVDSSLLRHCRLEMELLSLCETLFELAVNPTLLRVRHRDREARRAELLKWIGTFPEDYVDKAENLKSRVMDLFPEEGRGKMLSSRPLGGILFKNVFITFWSLYRRVWSCSIGEVINFDGDSTTHGNWDHLFAEKEWTEPRLKTFRSQRPNRIYVCESPRPPSIFIGFSRDVVISTYALNGPQHLSTERLQMELRAFRHRYSLLNTNEVRKIDSQEYLDRWQSMIVSDLPGKIIPPCDKTAILNAMIQLSHASGIAPTCLRIQDVGIKDLVYVPGAQCEMAQVFTGKVGPLDVMVKLLCKPLSEDDLKVGSRQALYWHKLEHANILPFLGLYYFDSSRTRVCLLYPWTGQGDLLKCANLQGVADGLGYLHGENVTHGRLKMFNVLVDSAGIPRIGDLGLATLSGDLAGDKNEDLGQLGRMVYEVYASELQLGSSDELQHSLAMACRLWSGIEKCLRANSSKSSTSIGCTLERLSPKRLHEVQDTNAGRDFAINIMGEWTPTLVCSLLDDYKNITGQTQRDGLRGGHKVYHGAVNLRIIHGERTKGATLSTPQALLRYLEQRERRDPARSLGPSVGIPNARPSSGKPLKPKELARKENGFRQLLEDREQYDEVVGLEGDEAQDVLDQWQRLSECTENADLRSHVIQASIQLSERSGLSPWYLQIDEVEDLSEHPIEYGDFGDIWIGSTHGVRVAVKVSRHTLHSQKHEQMIRAFTREALIWRNLIHPNILPFTGMYWFNEEQTQLCLVSPWMENGNLVQFLKDYPEVDRYTQQRLAEDVAQGLAYLHDLRITHGDLKGHNVLITSEHTACITDFGFARVIDNQSLAALSDTSIHQSTSVRWFAPELFKSGTKAAMSPDSDIYSFGCVCYEIYAKRPPFCDIKGNGIYYMVVVQNHRPELPRQVPDGMRRLIENCWRSEPSSRPKAASIVEMIGDMQADYADSDVSKGDVV
ncbi:hypothetical protein PM082_013290 [Marasmius tenuissimus]|nr:hypothetical protein PM082_013290 [Marasmius tenuissimus]